MLSQKTTSWKGLALALATLCCAHPTLLSDPDVVVLRPNEFVALRGAISEQTAREFTHRVVRPPVPKYVYIDSPGGDVDHGIAILRALPTNVTCVAARAISMAFVILQQCAHRVVLPTSELMQHQMHFAGEGVTGDLARVRAYVSYVDRQNRWLLEMQARRIGVSREWFDNRTRDEWWLFGAEAVREGCADRVVSHVRCDGKHAHAVLAVRVLPSCPLALLGDA